MATITIRTVAGQTIYDIALQYYGSVEKIDKVMEADNILSITDTIPPNTEIVLLDVDTNSINDFFATKKDIATDNVEPQPLLADEGGVLTGDEGGILFGD